MSDRVFGVFCVVLAGFFIWQATQIQTGFIVDPMGPRAFPIVIGATLALAAIYPIVRPDRHVEWPAPARLIEIAFAAALMFAYAQVLPELGFVASTAIAAALLSWRLGSKPVTAVVAGISIAILIYVIFHMILGLTLARGPWGF